MSEMSSVGTHEEGARSRVSIKALVGAGDRIGVTMLPVIAAGIVLQVWRPAFTSVGGPPPWLAILSATMLVPGVIVWAWSVVLILVKVPRGELITGGPYALVKHPLYTAVALLVLPWVGFLLNTWLGAVFGIALYLASRRFAPAEERTLAGRFGEQWSAYEQRVLLPWL